MKDLGNKIIANLHVFIVIYGIYGVWLMWDEHSIRMAELETQFPMVQSEIASTEKKVKEIQEFLKKTEESKVRVEEVAKNIEAAQKQLPAEISDDQIINFINAEISSLNIKDSSIVPGRETPSTYFISKEYAIRGKGTFLQFLVLFERIGNAARIYNVKSLKMTTVNENQRGRFQLINVESTIEAFRFNPNFKVDRGFDKIDPTAGAL